MKKLLSLLIFSFCISGIAMAAGSITLIGELRSFSEKTIEISDGKTVYSLDKKRIGAAQEKKLHALKIGAKTQVTVDFNAIVSTREIKK